MALWGKNDQANNSPLYTPMQFNKTPNTANRDALYNNTTANNVGTGETVGVYGVSVEELNKVVYSVTAAIANNAGDGDYVPGDVLTVGNTGQAGNTLSPATVTVASVKVANASVNAEGTGYTNGEFVGVDDITGLILEVTTDAGGNVASVVIDEDASLSALPTGGLSGLVTSVINTDSTGSGLTVDVETLIDSLTVTNPGNYIGNAPPTPTANPLSGGSGTGATAVLTVSETASAARKAGAPGWVLVKEGYGNRAGRTQYEVLATVKTLTGDGNDDTKFPE